MCVCENIVRSVDTGSSGLYFVNANDSDLFQDDNFLFQNF